MKSMFERCDIEEIILGMAAIVMENRTLRAELDEAMQYKKKYDELLGFEVKEAGRRQKDLFDAIMAGAFVYRETE